MKIDRCRRPALVWLKQVAGAFIHGCRVAKGTRNFLRVDGAAPGEVVLSDESALRIYDLMAEADALVAVEQGRVLYQDVNSPEFTARASRALRLSQEGLPRQSDEGLRARWARLVAEAASRFVEAATR